MCPVLWTPFVGPNLGGSTELTPPSHGLELSSSQGVGLGGREHGCGALPRRFIHGASDCRRRSNHGSSSAGARPRLMRDGRCRGLGSASRNSRDPWAGQRLWAKEFLSHFPIARPRAPSAVAWWWRSLACGRRERLSFCPVLSCPVLSRLVLAGAQERFVFAWRSAFQLQVGRIRSRERGGAHRCRTRR